MRSELYASSPDTIWPLNTAHQHFVQFYETDEFLLDTLATFVADTLNQGEASIVIATGDHLKGLRPRVRDYGIDIPSVSRSGQLVMLDAEETMQRFMVDDVPDPAKFANTFGQVVGQVAADWPAVRVFGEMVALIAQANDWTSTIELEQLWNDLQLEYEFTLCCAYPVGIFDKPESEVLLDGICDQHSAVFPAESYALLPTPEARMQEIAVLQQKASRLEREVAYRQQVEEKLRHALESERTAREQAEDALRMRDEFVSVAAHELKTPLTSLLGHSQLVLRGIQAKQPLDSERVLTAFRSVSRQADKLSRLVSQLLDISRLEGGKLSIERQPVDLAVLVREAADAVDTRNGKHAILINAPKSLIAEVDALRLEQVLANLLNNAVRYSPDGGAIEISMTTPGPNMIELAIRDHGLGIPEEKRDRIFERFYQAHQGESRSGIGLGLYISRQIVELHGGQVRAEFPSDGGTRVVVRLPARATPGDIHSK